MNDTPNVAIEIPNLAHRLFTEIRRDIVAGVLAPGSRLKTEELAKRYRTSANPVREALWRLQGEGFVILVPNQGARVRVVDDDFVRNIFEIREAIEPIIVRRFCMRCSKTDLERLETGAQAFAAAARRGADPDDLFQLNRGFHGILQEQEPNTEAIQVLERYDDLIAAARARLAMSRSATSRASRNMRVWSPPSGKGT
ncbi:MAG: GntR family transcriptional regulator [Rhizobiales bacterium]|nr:GntR family transcriptional regulator [Hyphomicrobiales bacterium]